MAPFPAIRRGLDSICTSDTIRGVSSFGSAHHSIEIARYQLAIFISKEPITWTEVSLRLDASRSEDEPRFERGSDGHFHWNCAGDCANFHTVIKRVAGSNPLIIDWTGSIVRIYVRCRECPACLRYRQMQWTRRIENELVLAQLRGEKVWMGTFTYRPNDPAGDYIKISGKRATDYLKRLRRRMQHHQRGRLRYVFVHERHKNGRLHLHGLFMAGSAVKRDFEAATAGRFGHCRFRLVADDPSSGESVSWYVAKYLAKEALGRVRCSLHFGRTFSALSREGRPRASDSSVGSQANPSDYPPAPPF